MSFPDGELVLAKRGNYTYWPAKVEETLQNGKVIVMFFGSRDVVRIQPSAIIQYDEETVQR